MIDSVHSEDLSLIKSAKCPRPFSIESLISSNSDKNVGVDAPTNNTNHTNVPSSALYFPANATMAAAATIYSPWFHNYFIQQQKLSGNVIDMMQMGGNTKDKLPEMFANSAILSEQRTSQTFEPNRNLPLPPSLQLPLASSMPPSILRNDGSGSEMISSPDTEYYKHLSSYGSLLAQYNDRLEQCRNDVRFSDDHNMAMNESNKFSGEFNISVRNDDSGPDETIEDDLDSDCNSEISMNMSPDGDHTNQGICNFLLNTICLVHCHAILD